MPARSKAPSGNGSAVPSPSTNSVFGSGARSRELEQLRHRVEPDDLAHERREGERQRAGAGADVEGALVAARLDEVAHLLREPRRPARPAAPRRAPPCARSGQSTTTRRARVGSELIPQAIS